MDLQVIRLQSPKYIQALTGLRAIAAYMVFFYHVPITWLVFGNFDIQRGFEAGVSIFFVLSGFVMTYTYQHTYRMNAFWYTNYLKNRVARIFPVYLLLAIPTLWLSHSDFFTWFVTITLLKGFFQSQFTEGLMHTWSLTAEMIFYTLAPLIFLFIDKFKSFSLLLISYVIGLLLFLAVLHFLQPSMMEPYFAVIRTFAGRFFEFFLGIWLAYRLKGNNWFVKAPATYIGMAGIVLSLVILAFRFSFLEENSLWRQGVYIFVSNIFLPVSSVFLLYGLVRQTTFISRIFSSRLFQVLGDSSYSFYIIHLGILHTFLLKYIYPPLIFFSLIIISCLLHYLVEKPFYRLLKNIRFSPFVKEKATDKIQT